MIHPDNNPQGNLNVLRRNPLNTRLGRAALTVLAATGITACTLVVRPEATPTSVHVELPTVTPTPIPTEAPTLVPTETPIPTEIPTPVPTETPTLVPTVEVPEVDPNDDGVCEVTAGFMVLPAIGIEPNQVEIGANLELVDPLDGDCYNQPGVEGEDYYVDTLTDFSNHEAFDEFGNALDTEMRVYDPSFVGFVVNKPEDSKSKVSLNLNPETTANEGNPNSYPSLPVSISFTPEELNAQ